MNFSFSDLIDFNKIPIKIFVLFSIVSGILLFSPENYLTILKVNDFEKEYGKYFGIIFIVCISFIILSIITYFLQKVQFFFIRRDINNDIKIEISTLDQFEKSVIREFIIMQRKTLSLPIDNPTVSALLNKRILTRVSNIGDGMYFATIISKNAFKQLKEEYLGLSSSMSEDEMRSFLSKRPKWADDYLYQTLNK